MDQFHFADIAPYLTHPLVLAGFVIMLFFGMIKALLKANIIPPLSQRTGGKVVMIFLRYGFWIAVLVVLLGFGLQFYKTHQDSRAIWQQGQVEASANINAIVKTLTEKHQQDLQTKDEQIKALTESVTALSQGKVNASESAIKAALAALTKGDTALAKRLFAETAQAIEPKALEAAAAYRHLGALAWWDDTQQALQAYRRATELDPNNADGWNQLGNLLMRTGELNQAEIAYQKVLQLGEQHQDKQEQSAAYGNLGIVYRIRGDLDQALAMYNKALAIDEPLGLKIGMANNYANLGNVYRTRGDLDQARKYYQQSIALFKTIGSPKQQLVQGWLDALQ